MFGLRLTLALTLAVSPQTTTQPPAGVSVVVKAQGRGVQIYRCSASQWIFQAPEAELFDGTGNLVVGKHSAGPTWLWGDGSSIQGKVLAKDASPDAGSIPWLLLEAHATQSSAKGILSEVTYVRRSETEGGNAPATGCDASHEGATVRVPYKANYTFYKHTH